MRIRAVTLTILALGGGVWIFQQNHIARLESRSRDLAARLAASPQATGSAGSNKPIRSGGIASLPDVPWLASALIGFAADTTAEASLSPLELASRIAALDRKSMRLLIAELLANEELQDDSRGNLMAMALMLHASDHPAAAAEMAVEQAASLAASPICAMAVSSIIKNWATLDPETALEWVKSHSESHPEIVGAEAKLGLVSGVSSSDPSRAFALLTEWNLLDEPGSLAAIIDHAGNSPSGRNALISSLRIHAQGLSDPEHRERILDEAFSRIGFSAAVAGFDSFSSWTSGNPLTPDELRRVSTGLHAFQTRGETGKWVDWLANNLPKEQIENQVSSLVADWTRDDYLAAGTWLQQSFNGPLGPVAVRAYAGAVAEYDPATAVRWALTIPPGPEQRSTLTTILRHWPADDPQGAADFARTHDLE